jgi:hypothetical protein
MRLMTLLSPVGAASAAEAAVRNGVLPVEATANPLTPWLAIAFLAMMAILFAACWLVTRGPGR